MSKTPLVELLDLKKHFKVSSGLFGRNAKYLRAVDGVDLTINRGETLGLVGESGCGKSTLARTLIRLYEPTSGQMKFDGEDIAALDQKSLMPFRKRMQMIFQDPYASLNGRMTVHDLIAEPLEIANIGDTQSRTARVHELLEIVGLNKDHAMRFAHEFSGGQRQRIGIARAIALNPELVICDEPISALDVSIQAQVVNMLEDLQRDLGLTYLFITHDLSMVRHISDRIGVMYLGKIVELADNDELYENPKHPYTRALLSSIPIADPVEARKRKIEEMQGEIPSPIDMPSGCRFRTRCPLATELCATNEPKLKELTDGHLAACHYAEP
ncbi:ABC transporter ATP-binding protein [Maritalea porphyrae]|mgnify:CR=1 FL=1|jgi:oligopeptide transport system ATP-binding protein|uniref:ABC transporter ATP-binding protein n=1 Tax=Maritalea porphyrae TaxID=880732 RepID=UPI0022AEE79D|nr:dipeptide ABC transporter ATP-binding protein [Maritalea porphyrae]MCZ4272045.1 dipeptide ABC transporter ATP-binding protein [Maritalea porphyrae]